MKYLWYVIIVLIAGFLFYFGVLNEKIPKPSDERPAEEPLAAPGVIWETKVDAEPPVTIAITPVEFGKDANVWKFNVAFTTHSGSLDDDPVKVSFITDDKGNIYSPIGWNGPGPGGHHREGVLIFNSIAPASKYIELKFKNVGGVPERVFVWVFN